LICGGRFSRTVIDIGHKHSFRIATEVNLSKRQSKKILCNEEDPSHAGYKRTKNILLFGALIKGRRIKIKRDDHQEKAGDL
jgi:hypothetical protein